MTHESNHTGPEGYPTRQFFYPTLAFLVAVLALAALSSPAWAGPPSTDTLLRVAAGYWQVDRATPTVLQDGDVVCSQTPDAVACARLNEPIIHLRPGRWNALDNPTRCAVMIHEYGHAMLGLEHSPDPASVMHAPIEAASTICARYMQAPTKGIFYSGIVIQRQATQSPRRSRVQLVSETSATIGLRMKRRGSSR